MAEEEQALSPRRGYDIVAPHYEAWRWFKLWQMSEEPIVYRWLASLPHGVGLDAGSGTGRYAELGAAVGHQCAAIDISLQMLRVGSARHRHTALWFVEGDIATMPFRDRSFDWLLCARVLSHQPDPAPAFREFARVLHGGAVCLVSDVHPEHPYNQVKVDVGGREVALATFKHSLRRIVDAATGDGSFTLVDLKEHHFNDLPVKPPREAFAKLYRQANPAIFYVCRLRRSQPL